MSDPKSIAVVLVVVAVAFVCGWQAGGVASGVGLAAALGGGAIVAVVGQGTSHRRCLRLRRRRADPSGP